jgi:hypothetical protein
MKIFSKINTCLYSKLPENLKKAVDSCNKNRSQYQIVSSILDYLCLVLLLMLTIPIIIIFSIPSLISVIFYIYYIGKKEKKEK